MKLVSFDFDGTLERKHIQDYAKELLLRDDIEVWIVTSRYDDEVKFQKFFKCSTNIDLVNKDLWDVANELGIPKERVHFTNMENKYHFIKTKNFIWHIDDDWTENSLINKHTKTKPVASFGNSSWKQKCERILKRDN